MSASRQHHKLVLAGLTKRYGAFTALEPTDLSVHEGEFLTLLGPSGSGKTTLLQMIAGLTQPSAGRLFIDGADWTQRPVNQRGMGLVFQHYALFPHMTVAENVAFPLQMRKLSDADAHARVAQTLAKVQLTDFAHRFPQELSGGQQQRVALARCFVFNPRLVLMDEPLGALDKALRETMQLEIRRMHKEYGATVIYVTHDQEEALIMSDRICVMNHARVEQIGTPQSIYADPETLFAATFIGHSNVFKGKRVSVDSLVDPRVATRSGGDTARVRTAYGEFSGGYSARDRASDDVALVIRPEQVSLGPAPTEAYDGVTGTLADLIYVGEQTRLLVRLQGGEEIMLRHDPATGRPPAIGAPVSVHWRKSQARVVA